MHWPDECNSPVVAETRRGTCGTRVTREFTDAVRSLVTPRRPPIRYKRMGDGLAVSLFGQQVAQAR